MKKVAVDLQPLMLIYSCQESFPVLRKRKRTVKIRKKKTELTFSLWKKGKWRQGSNSIHATANLVDLIGFTDVYQMSKHTSGFVCETVSTWNSHVLREEACPECGATIPQWRLGWNKSSRSTKPIIIHFQLLSFCFLAIWEKKLCSTISLCHDISL